MACQVFPGIEDKGARQIITYLTLEVKTVISHFFIIVYVPPSRSWTQATGSLLLFNQASK